MLSSIIFSATLNRNGRVNKEGKRAIVISIYQTGTRERVTITTHIHVRAGDFRHGKVQSSDPNYDIYNARIRRRIRKLMEYEDEIEQRGQQPTPRRIREAAELHMTPTATISEFVSSVIDSSSRAPQTKASYHTLARQLEDYHPHMTLSDISHDFIERWRTSMVSAGTADNTIKGRLKQLRCLVNEALKRDVITADPFKAITIGNMSPKVEYLTTNEVKKFEDAKLEGREAVVRDLFCLSAYTGLRWSDLTTLEEAEIKDGILRKRMYKTKLDVTIPIGTLFWGKGKEIIDRYTPITELSKCVKSNSTANKIIKDIAKRIGIKKQCHFHLSRKSCCQLLNTMGMDMADISSMLAHREIRTTKMCYVFGDEERVKKIVKKIFK